MCTKSQHFLFKTAHVQANVYERSTFCLILPRKSEKSPEIRTFRQHSVCSSAYSAQNVCKRSTFSAESPCSRKRTDFCLVTCTLRLTEIRALRLLETVRLSRSESSCFDNRKTDRLGSSKSLLARDLLTIRYRQPFKPESGRPLFYTRAVEFASLQPS